MPKKSQRILRYSLILLVVLVVAAFAYRIYQIQTEKRDFAKAEQSIDSLAQQIEQLIGKPDETRKEKTCNRSNMKNAQGPPMCFISSYHTYKNTSHTDANTRMQTTKKLGEGALRVGSAASDGNAFNDKADSRFNQVFYQSINIIGSLNCDFSYDYTLDAQEFELGIICSDSVIKEIYPH